MSRPIEEVAAERLRQILVEGWSLTHDDEHSDGELALAAACYAALHHLPFKEVPMFTGTDMIPRLWPWDKSWWKPKDRRRDLIRAAALIIAEIERLDRLTDQQKDETP